MLRVPTSTKPFAARWRANVVLQTRAPDLLFVAAVFRSVLTLYFKKNSPLSL